MSTQKPTIFFLGATSGCTLAALIHTLNAGYPSIALARTPSKLTQLLLSAGISQTTLNTLLQIHPGNALSVSDIKTALLLASPSQSSPALPTTIISGLGASPQFSFRSLNPLNWITIDNPTLCGTAAATLVSALQELYTEHPSLLRSPGHKPLLAFISTTGISNHTEDVPFWMRFLYHTILAVPHKDKRVMEEVFRPQGNSQKQTPRNDDDGVFRAVIGVRPTLLTSAEPKGIEKIRVGREERPEMGYTVSRGDVGEWVYRVVVEGDGKGWEGECASLTN